MRERFQTLKLQGLAGTMAVHPDIADIFSVDRVSLTLRLYDCTSSHSTRVDSQLDSDHDAESSQANLGQQVPVNSAQG